MRGRIYYTGDVANQPGWFRVVSEAPEFGSVRVEEEDGDRRFVLHLFEIGDRYEGHHNPRFVTEAAYRAYRASRGVKE